MAQINLNSTEHTIWFTSDTHFGHNNILRYCCRPFSTIEEMNEEFIANWNALVKPDDIVFHLGDFGMNLGSGELMNIRNRLNGKIYLIIGNHDWRSLKNKPFYDSFEMVTQQLRIRIDGQLIYLNHMPLLCFDGAYRKDNPTWQLFGHVHSGPAKENSDTSRLLMLFPTQYDVGVDNNNYKPVSYQELVKIINNKIDTENMSSIFVD